MSINKSSSLTLPTRTVFASERQIGVKGHTQFYFFIIIINYFTIQISTIVIIAHNADQLILNHSLLPIHNNMYMYFF